MNIQRSIIFTLLFFLQSVICLFATGPSYVSSIIKPISINDKGEVLCRTRYQENGMGSHDLLPIEYGLCVLTSDTIFEFKTFDLKYWDEYPDMDTYITLMGKLDSLLNASFDYESLLEDEKVIVDKYNFKESNIESYLRDDTLVVDEFQKLKNIDLFKHPQFALHGAKGYYITDEDNSLSDLVCFLYDFGNVILLRNLNDYEVSVGATFDYKNTMEPFYENTYITGVLFLKKD